MTTYTKEINDKAGDLIDMEFRCADCYERGLTGSYAYWYADYRETIPSDFSTDYPSFCKSCDTLLNDVPGYLYA